MHQNRTIVQTLLILSILNLAFAAPVVVQEIHDRRDDVVAALAESVSERRGDPEPGGLALSQYPSSSSPPPADASPPHHSLPLEESGFLQGSPPSDGSAPPSHLSPTVGPAPVHDSMTEGTTSAAPHLSATDRPVTEHGPVLEGSASMHHWIEPDMLFKGPHVDSPMVKNLKTGAGVLILGGIIGGLVWASRTHSKDD